jgi:hypothetical protein
MKTLILLLALFTFSRLYAQTGIVLTEAPQHFQLYQREGNNRAVITIAGSSYDTRFDSVYVTVSGAGDIAERIAAPLIYDNGRAQFLLEPSIIAGPNEHDFSIYVKSGSTDSLIAFRDSVVAGDVYIIDGQSNTVWTGDVGNLYSDEYCRSFGFTASANPADTLWARSVAVLSAGVPNVGSWALRLQQRILEEQGIPTCIINGGVGGTAIESHQRSDANPTDLNTIYGSLLYRVQKAKVTTKAKAIFWYQGESNGPINYYNNFKAMYDDWREDYPNFTKLYVFQVHHGCNAGEPHGQVREILRSIKDSIPNVVQVSVMGIMGHDGCHYTLNGYTAIGDMVYRQVARDFYNSDDKVGIDPPNILKAFFRDEAHTKLVLEFSSAGTSLMLPNDTTVQGISASLKEYFYLDTDTAVVSDISSEGNKLVLYLKSPSSAKSVTYLPDTYYDGTGIVYQGPYLTNSRGIGALSFWRFPITDSVTVSVNLPSDEVSVSAYPNPFTGITTVGYKLAKTANVKIEIVDVLGRTEQVLVDKLEQSGPHEVTFDTLSTGVYFCRITIGDAIKTIRLVSE